MANEEREIEIKHTKDEKLKKLLKELMEENIELFKELAKSAPTTSSMPPTPAVGIPDFHS